MILYTTDVNRILSRIPITARIYQGCFPSDMIPKCKKFPCAMVVNFDDSTEPGTHWAAMYSRTPVQVFYFDSLGMGIEEIDDIRQYIRANFMTSTQQHLGIQKIGTTVCGHYAIFFVYACARNIPWDKIECMLATRKDPDRFVLDFVNKLNRK